MLDHPPSRVMTVMECCSANDPPPVLLAPPEWRILRCDKTKEETDARKSRHEAP
jgi:hypothetical protein